MKPIFITTTEVLFSPAGQSIFNEAEDERVEAMTRPYIERGLEIVERYIGSIIEGDGSTVEEYEVLAKRPTLRLSHQQPRSIL